MPLYFAYDGLMDETALKALAPRATRLGLARLPRHRLVPLGNGFATIRRDPRRAVEGTLYDIPFGDLAAVDRRAAGATKLNQPVITSNGAKLTLLHVPVESGASPTGKDRTQLAAAARAAGLPEAYCAEIETGEPPKRKPGAPLFAAPTTMLKR